MPAKHVSARRKNLHILAGIVAEGTVITDTRKQKFFVEREFARGGFGRIYSAHQINGHKYSKKESLVIKVEPCANGPLFTEITVFQRILKMEMLQEWIQKKKLDHLGLPPFISSGIFEHNKESLRFLIMPKYGESLESFRKRSGGKLEKKLALKIAIQCANCLSYMQEQNYVHSDIKADNILCGSSKNFANCVLVDFGLAKMAKNNIDKPDKKKAHNGTLLFTSIDAHRGCDPSFRADLEILLYNLMYWITGSLPWTDSLHSSDEVFKKKLDFSKNIKKSVMELIPDGYGKEIAEIFTIVYETNYSHKIDYDLVQIILTGAMNLTTKSATVAFPKKISTEVCARLSMPVKESSCLKNIGTKADEKQIDGLTVSTDNSLPKTIVGKTARKTVVQKVLNSHSNTTDFPGLNFSRKRKRRSFDKSIRKSPRLIVSKENLGKIKMKDQKIDINSELIKEQKLKKILKHNVSEESSTAVEAVASITEKSFGEDDISNISGKSSELASVSAASIVIPGVRNMNRIRRSLAANLVKKYSNLATKNSQK